MATIGEVNQILWKFVIQWKIKDIFSLSSKEDEFWLSPSFSFANTSWCLRIYPNGQSKAPLNDGQMEDSIGYIGIYLLKISSGPPIHMNYLLGLKTVDKKIEFKFHQTYNFKEMGGFGRHKFISRSKLLEKKSELMPCDVLTLICKVKHPELAAIASKFFY